MAIEEEQLDDLIQELKEPIVQSLISCIDVDEGYIEDTKLRAKAKLTVAKALQQEQPYALF